MYSMRGPISRERLTKATKSLDHRGPDGRGEWIDASRRVGLGHARLSIIDLAGGTQPLSNEDGTIHAVVNGEIYDFARMREELVAKGHRFRTGSDSEVLIHLYEEHGPACPALLRGEIAFVLYDAKNDLLLAGRDRFGIKPLHYAYADGVLVVASEAKALFAAGVRARWDLETYFHASALGGPLDDRSFFDGVSQVPAGHYMLATRRFTRVVRYWDFDYPLSSAGRSRSESEDVEALGSTIDEAVRLRLRADVPVACYLSGGIDSCAVLGVASRAASSPIRAFTIAFDQPAYDEAAIAKEMADHAGAEYTPVPVSEADFARDLADATWHAERPLNNANSIAKFRLSRAVRDAGVKVVLTGEGADEIFAGYPHYRRDLFLHSKSAVELVSLDKANAVSKGILLPQGAGLSTRAVRNAVGSVPTWLEAFATSGQKTRSILAPSFLDAYADQEPFQVFVGTLEVPRQLTGRHPVHQAMYLWSKSVLPNFILSVLGDRMEMAHSIEGRLPFLDHHVVELAARMPIDRLIRGTVEKHVLREAVKPVVTDTVYRRQKHPFFAPPASSGKGGALRELMQDTLRGSGLRDVPFFDPQRVISLLDSLPQIDDETRTGVDATLMLVLTTTIMHRRFAMVS
jgi:asparagine synthase (glutamine-hydrolysing)